MGKEAHTSSLRAFFALHEYVRWLSEEEPLKDIQSALAVDFVTGEVALSRLKRVMTGYLASNYPKEEHKTFRDSHFLMAASVLDNVMSLDAQSKQPATDEERQQFQKSVHASLKASKEIAKQTALRLQEHEGGRALPADQIHDFITLYALRGIDALRFATQAKDETLEHWMITGNPDIPGDQRSVQGLLYDRSRKHVPRLLGYHAAGVSSRFDPVELTFSVELLNRLSPVNDSDLTMQALNCIAASQLDDGAWPQGDMVSYEASGHPHLASYEVALSLVHTLNRQVVDRHDLRFCTPVLEALTKSFRLVRASYREVSGYRGWANDHARLRKLLESWATAVVLTFLIHYHDLLIEIRQRMILGNYTVAEPSRIINPILRQKSPKDALYWPDMKPAFRRRSGFDTKNLEDYWEPVGNASIAEAVKKRIFKVIEEDPVCRPPGDCQAMILWGDPGTGKTNLAERIAEGLNWPLITVSPPDFLRQGGLEGIESAANDVFHDLAQLRRTVILFDECEDFFKKRGRKQKFESRTIGAFITSGMLPRLQNLKKRRWSFLFLATNSKLEEIDEAVRRPGRFSASLKIGHPDIAAQCAMVDTFLSKDKPKSGMPSADAISLFKDGLERYHNARGQAIDEDRRTGKKDFPAVSFLMLQQLVRDYFNSPLAMEAPNPERIFEIMSNYLRQSYPPSFLAESKLST